MNNSKKIDTLRKLMKKSGVDIYIIPTCDYHGSEYVGEYFKTREYITGFTGSAGTAVITMEEACLWTDGRYFLQAKIELAGSGVELMKAGEPGVPTVFQWIEKKLKKSAALAFDGRYFSAKDGQVYSRLVADKKAKLISDLDLVGQMWEGRPDFPCSPLWHLDVTESGMSTKAKLEKIRAIMKKKKADIHIVSCLYDIAWILNARAADVKHVPVFMSYLLITMDEATVFLNKSVVNDGDIEIFAKSGVRVASYDEIYSAIEALPEKKAWLLDTEILNFELYEKIRKRDELILDIENPSIIFRAVKNSTEIKNTCEAHRLDGIAMCEFIFELKERIKAGEKLSELEVAKIAYEKRASKPGFLEESFETIAAYGKNGAIVHYTATKENFSYLKPKGMILVDSGAHYKTGTTDITRTICLGPLSEKEKRFYTYTLKAHLRLMMASFKNGVTGINLDMLARNVIWERGLDYRHGTGHGVGHILNVHEGPHNINWKSVKYPAGVAIVPGMVVTDEPGLYEEGEFGIRIENELLCIKDKKTQYGQFYKFRVLTLVPIDKDPIEKSLLTDEEVTWLNDYHRLVYKSLKNDIKDEGLLAWLKDATKPI